MTLLTSGQLHQGRPSSSVMVRISSNMKSRLPSKWQEKSCLLKMCFVSVFSLKRVQLLRCLPQIIPFHSIRQLLMMLITMGVNNRPASKGI